MHSTPDGAICGNGDVGVILGEHENGLSCYVSKSDFWLAGEMGGDDGGIKPVGMLKIDVPKKLYNNYHVEQRMDEGEIFCRFSDGNESIETLIFVSHKGNSIWIETTYSNGLKAISASFAPADIKSGTIKKKEIGSTKVFKREFKGDNLVFGTRLTVAVSQKIFNNKCICNIVLNSNHDGTPLILEELSEEKFEEEHNDNLKWWENFYKKSSFKTSDTFLEMNWYASQYLLAVCALNNEFPPGLYGNFITKDGVNWKGDYHLNYNYQGSFYGACSSNHVELTDCYATPILAMQKRGNEFSKKFLNQKGVFYPVGIGPKGMITERSDDVWEKMFLGQRSNAVHATDIMIMRWYSTYDVEYAKRIYPFFLDVADFWEGYLEKRDGTYNVVHDAIHEIPYYKDNFDPKKYKKEINEENNLLSLGLLRMFFKCIIDMSAELDADADRRAKWQDIADNLHEFPTFVKRGRRVYRYTSNGTAWNNTNTLCIQHIYPCGQIGLNSDCKALKIARNTFFTNDRWNDGNGGCSYYPCAARLAISPKLIIKKMKKNFKKFQLPNLLFLHGGGCLENSSIASATLNEMMLQSYEGIIRIFPDWDTDIDCAFENLRAYGAFLVSSSVEKSQIGQVIITSEKGRRLVLENPFENAKIKIGNKEIISDERVLTMDTKEGSVIYIENNN